MGRLFLYPFSWLYGMVTWFRNRLYDWNILKSKEFEIPVIAVGNITVGGTGKTPHVEYLAGLLKDRFTVATLSRGYKRKTKGFRWVETNSDVSDTGDEPLQIKRKYPEVLVSVCENRVFGMERLLNPGNEKVPDVVLLDDAFQHRRITPGRNILLVDYNRPLKEDMLLPAGRLRESKSQMRRADIIIFTKCPDEVTPIMRRILQKEVRLKPYQELYFTSLAYDTLKPVFSGNLTEDFSRSKDSAILAVTGIASPHLMVKYLEKNAGKFDHLAFPDHHHYTKEDVQAIYQRFAELPTPEKIMVTTEKDAMHFRDLPFLTEDFKNALFYLPVRVLFSEEEKIRFNKKILDYVGENNSNRKLYKRTNRVRP